MDSAELGCNDLDEKSKNKRRRKFKYRKKQQRKKGKKEMADKIMIKN